MSAIKNQINLMFTALMFFTRIPCPFKVPYSSDILNRSSRYYSLIGALVGGIAALVYWGASHLFNNHISILLSMISTILATGSFHEDGMADSCDALGGGYEKERILEIMKDSRIGTFGSVALISILSLKFFSLDAIPNSLIVASLVVGHSFSRTVSAIFIYISPYVSSAKSKSKPLANKMYFSDLFINILVAMAFYYLFFKTNYQLLLVLFAVFIVFGAVVRVYIHKKIGGYTGDILGGIQQIMEVLIYLSIGVWF